MSNIRVNENLEGNKARAAASTVRPTRRGSSTTASNITHNHHHSTTYTTTATYTTATMCTNAEDAVNAALHIAAEGAPTVLLEFSPYMN